MSRVLVVDDEKLIVKGIMFSLEQDLSIRRSQVAGDHIDDSTLTGAVCSDQPVDPAFFQIHIDMVNRQDSLKLLGQPFDLKYFIRHLFPHE